MLNKRTVTITFAIVAAICVASQCRVTKATNYTSFFEARISKNPCINLVQRLAAGSRSALLAAYGASEEVAASWDLGLFTGTPVTAIGEVAAEYMRTGGTPVLLAAAQQLIPRRSALQLASTGSSQSQEGVTIIRHTVAQGESLSTIAAKYSVTINTIAWANNLTNVNKLKVGQVLEFPSISGVIHKVRSGESIWTIAKRYGVSGEEIVQANALDDPNRLALNQVLVIPGGRPLSSQSSTVQLASRGSTSSRDGSSGGGTSALSFAWPATGRISSNYGLRWGRTHHGIDLAVPIGTTVRAAAAGKVIFSGTQSGYGRLVIIDHGNGITTRYGHNSKLLVSVGQWVEAGERIALSGNTGNSTGPHLHLEIRINGSSVDPLKNLK